MLRNFDKRYIVRLLAMTIAALTIMGSYSFVVASVAHGQWMSDTVFLAVVQLIAVCAMAVAAYICPRYTQMLCWIYIVLVAAEIACLFSGYHWAAFEQPEFVGEILTLRLINREWGYRLIALILAFVTLILSHKNKRE